MTATNLNIWAVRTLTHGCFGWSRYWSAMRRNRSITYRRKRPVRYDTSSISENTWKRLLFAYITTKFPSVPEGHLFWDKQLCRRCFRGFCIDVAVDLPERWAESSAVGSPKAAECHVKLPRSAGRLVVCAVKSRHCSGKFQSKSRSNIKVYSSPLFLVYNIYLLIKLDGSCFIQVIFNNIVLHTSLIF